MTLFGTTASPSGGGIAVSPFYEVESVLHPLVHLRHRHYILSLVAHTPTAVGALTRNAAGQDGQGSHPEVFAELEILVVTEAHRLVIAPSVLEMTTFVTRTDGGLPAIGVPESVASAMHDATAGEAQEFRLQVGKSLCEVLAQTVSFVSVLGHE